MTMHEEAYPTGCLLLCTPCLSRCFGVKQEDVPTRLLRLDTLMDRWPSTKRCVESKGRPFIDLVRTPGLVPDLSVAAGEDLRKRRDFRELADAYDTVQEWRGDARRAYRKGPWSGGWSRLQGVPVLGPSTPEPELSLGYWVAASAEEVLGCKATAVSDRPRRRRFKRADLEAGHLIRQDQAVLVFDTPEEARAEAEKENARGLHTLEETFRERSFRTLLPGNTGEHREAVPLPPVPPEAAGPLSGDPEVVRLELRATVELAVYAPAAGVVALRAGHEWGDTYTVLYGVRSSLAAFLKRRSAFGDDCDLGLSPDLALRAAPFTYLDVEADLARVKPLAVGWLDAELLCQARMYPESPPPKPFRKRFPELSAAIHKASFSGTRRSS